MKEQIRQLVIVSVVVAAFCTTQASAQLVKGNYSIELGTDGTITGFTGTGYGGVWYEYPGERYIMWFQSTGFDSTMLGDVNLSVLIEALNPDIPVTYSVDYGWTKPAWTNTSRPPLPDDVLAASESTYFARQFVRNITGDTWFLPATEYTAITRNAIVEDYHPEWVYVSVSGTNIAISRFMTIESIEFVEPKTGACCESSTGLCYITDNGSCFQGYDYLGDGTDCGDCEIQNFASDFGDAPPQYPVTLAQNGAQHTNQSGMYLGSGITTEANGQPHSQALGDLWDDGVTFNSQVTTGQSATVTIVASTLGVINAWLDLNSDGDWADVGEHILVDEPVVQGQNTMSFYVPFTATAGQSFARFRYNSSGGIDFAGPTPDGEVEDYSVAILSGTNPNPDPDPGISAISPTDQFASKWFQPVNKLTSSEYLIYGWSLVTRHDLLPMIADDWPNGSVLPIQGFRWWGAFDNWFLAEMPASLPVGFHIGIWSHNPAIEKPRAMVWEHATTSWTWAYTGQIRDAQGQIGGEAVFEFKTLLSQNEWFYPNTAPNTTYWLSITPIYSAGVVSRTPWGWMTRQTEGTLPAERILSVFNPAQWPPVLGANYEAGSPITYPATTNWDMAFELITSQPRGEAVCGSDSDLAKAIGDLNDDGVIDVNDLYVLLGFVSSP